MLGERPETHERNNLPKESSNKSMLSKQRIFLLAGVLAAQVGFSHAWQKMEQSIDKTTADITNTLDVKPKSVSQAELFNFIHYKNIPYSSLFGKDDKDLLPEENQAKELFISGVAAYIDAIKGTNWLPLRAIKFPNSNIAKKYWFPTSAWFAIKDGKNQNRPVTFAVDKTLAQDESFVANSQPWSYQVVWEHHHKVKDPVFEITIWTRRFIVKSNIPGVTIDGIKMVKNKKTQNLEVHIPVKAIWLFSRTIKRDGTAWWKDMYDCYFWVPFGWEKIIEGVKIIDISSK